MRKSKCLKGEFLPHVGSKVNFERAEAENKVHTGFKNIFMDTSFSGSLVVIKTLLSSNQSPDNNYSLMLPKQ